MFSRLFMPIDRCVCGYIKERGGIIIQNVFVLLVIGRLLVRFVISGILQIKEDFILREDLP